MPSTDFYSSPPRVTTAVLSPKSKTTAIPQQLAPVIKIPPKEAIDQDCYDDPHDFKIMSINSDWSNRSSQAKGPKLYGAAGAVVSSEEKKPKAVIVEEIGPRNARGVVRACEGYEGECREVDTYSNVLIMWQKERFTRLKAESFVAGRYCAVTLLDTLTEEKKMVVGTHQPWISSGAAISHEANRLLREFLLNQQRREVVDVVATGGDFNTTARSMRAKFPSFEIAFEDDVAHATSAKGCLDNFLCPAGDFSFGERHVLDHIATFSHKPVVATYKRRSILI